jgi:hypothetical protein
MWNIYIMALVFLYAPSHKNWNTGEANDATPGGARPDGTRTGEEIEFSVASVSAMNDNDPSELHSLTEFIRHQAQD